MLSDIESAEIARYYEREKVRLVEAMVRKEETAIMASREASGMDKDMSSYATGAGIPNAGNGVQDGFGTGATRSTSEGKVDYEGHINPEVLALFGEYMNAHRIQRDGQLRSSDNWQKGIPVYRYMKSLIRHTIELWRMWRGNPVWNVDSGRHFTFREVFGAIFFNISGLMFEFERKYSGLLDNSCISTGYRQELEAEDQTPAAASFDPYLQPVKGKDPRAFEKLCEQNKAQQAAQQARCAPGVGCAGVSERRSR